MSSLSQEDLDADWGDIDDSTNATAEGAVGPTPQASSPPNSVTVSNGSTPPQSMVVRAKSAHDEDPTPEESNAETEAHPDVEAALSEPAVVTPPDATASAELTSDASGVEPQATADMPSEPVEEKPQESAFAKPDVPIKSEVDEASAEIDQTGAPTPEEPVEQPSTSDTASSVVAAKAEPAPEEPVEQPSTSDTTSSVVAAKAEPAPDPVVRQPDNFIATHRRSLVIAAAATAVAALATTFMVVRSHRVASKPLRHGIVVGAAMPRVGQPVSPSVEDNSPVAPVPLVASSAPEPSAVPTSQPSAASAVGSPPESFSDAFVKHAASVNSSWVEVKKRSRVVESSRGAKAGPSSAKASEDPLDVLDKLEKARRAKQAAGK